MAAHEKLIFTTDCQNQNKNRFPFFRFFNVVNRNRKTRQNRLFSVVLMVKTNFCSRLFFRFYFFGCWNFRLFSVVVNNNRLHAQKQPILAISVLITILQFCCIFRFPTASSTHLLPLTVEDHPGYKLVSEIKKT